MVYYVFGWYSPSLCFWNNGQAMFVLTRFPLIKIKVDCRKPWSSQWRSLGFFYSNLFQKSSVIECTLTTCSHGSVWEVGMAGILPFCVLTGREEVLKWNGVKWIWLKGISGFYSLLCGKRTPSACSHVALCTLHHSYLFMGLSHPRGCEIFKDTA